MGKKTVFAIATTLMFLLLLEGVLILCGADADFNNNDPYAGFASHVPHFVPSESEDGIDHLTVSASKADVLNPLSFAAAKPANTYRIICVGGSTTYGRPFFDETSFAGWLRVLLPAMDPSRDWEVINAGAVSYASYRVVGVMDELAQYDPDLFIVYTGHNEFLERRTYQQLLEQPLWMRESISLLSHTRTAAAIRWSLESVGVATRRPSIGTVLADDVKRIPINAVGPEAYRRDHKFRHQVIDHFGTGLAKMLEIAERAEAEVMFITPACNLADFAPFKSEHAASLVREDKRRWQELFARAKQLLSENRPIEALEMLKQAEKLDDLRADLHYVKGKALLELERYEEAAEAFHRSKEEDVCPLRAIDVIVNSIRKIGDSQRTNIVDFERIVAENSDHRIADQRLFHDHIHLTVDANLLLSRAVMSQLVETGTVTVSSDAQARASLAVDQMNSRVDGSRYARELLTLSSILVNLNQHTMAIAQAESACELSAHDEDIVVPASRILLQLDQPRSAMKVMKTVVTNNPRSGSARCQFALTLLAQQQADESLREFDEALQLDPDLADAHRYAGLLRAERGQLPRAEYHFAQLVRLAPDDSAAFENLALCLAKQDRHREAVEHYQRALELNPRSVSARRNFASTLEALGHAEEARKQVDAASRLDHRG